MPDQLLDLTQKKIIQRQLSTLRKQTKQSYDDFKIDEQTNPKWLDQLQVSIQQKQATALTNHFIKLLKSLPLVAKAKNEAASASFFEAITAELVKIYYVRLRLIELDQRLTLQERSQRINNLLNECEDRLINVATLFTQYS